ncbi:MAG: protease HtpX [Succinivibrio sp.]|nr:protease HtpX [Succinivibrio sp.]
MRIVLFIGMQIAVLLVVSIVGGIILNVLGIQLDEMSMLGLLATCAIYGCVGSTISLFMSKSMCKRSYRIVPIEVPRTEAEQFIYNTVAEFAQKYQFKMPEVGIYQSDDPNAFATGASKNGALVAVSTGLLRSMNKEEIRGVLGHEMSHVQNGDMVTMALLQGVLNTFVYFFSYLITFALMSARNRDSENRGGMGYSAMNMAVNGVCQMIFGVAANMILMAFSRHREFKADAGSADLAGTQTMIRSLQALQRGVQPQQMTSSMAALCINAPSAISNLFRSHPPLEDRIAALSERRYQKTSN